MPIRNPLKIRSDGRGGLVFTRKILMGPGKPQTRTYQTFLNMRYDQFPYTTFSSKKR